jgi:hypothetical protein
VEFLAWIEESFIGVWVREAPTVWAFPFVLILHTVGLAIVGGSAVILNAQVFTRPQDWNPSRFEPLFQFAWTGFAINLVSGVLLLSAYPTKALTNPVFYAKLACVAGAMVQLQWLRNRAANAVQKTHTSLVVNTSVRVLRRSAIAAFLLWGTGVVTGRFLAYTYRYLMTSDMSLGIS